MSFQSLTEVVFEDGHNWRLIVPLVYQTHAGDVITVPAGFETDFASIPRALWSLFPPAGPWGPAAVIHDFLYRTGLVPRAECDRLFREASEDLGVPAWIRWTMWTTLRAAGGQAYQPAPGVVSLLPGLRTPPTSIPSPRPEAPSAPRV